MKSTSAKSTSKSEWGGLFNDFDGWATQVREKEDLMTEEQAEQILKFGGESEWVKINIKKIKATLQKMSPAAQVVDFVVAKRAKHVRELTDEHQKVYKELTAKMEQKDIKRIVNIALSPIYSNNKRVSGRDIDCLCTKFLQLADCILWLDYSRGEYAPALVKEEDAINMLKGTDKNKKKNLRRINLEESYALHMRKYSKCLFDAFGRGDLVKVEVGQESFSIPLTKLNFFIWWVKHGLQFFLDKNYHEIKKLKRKMSKYEAKKKRKFETMQMQMKRKITIDAPISFEKPVVTDKRVIMKKRKII